jgi:hypothetical protein
LERKGKGKGNEGKEREASGVMGGDYYHYHQVLYLFSSYYYELPYLSRKGALPGDGPPYFTLPISVRPLLKSPLDVTWIAYT